MPEASTDCNEVDVSIVLPAYNEESAIVAVIREVRDAMANWPGGWEILVVDDGSQDRTSELADGEKVRVIRRVENTGSGAARAAGILAARGRIVAMLDADGSYDPSQLPHLLSFLPDYDQVNGARIREEGDHRWLRMVVKYAIRKLAEATSGKRIPDLNTGFKVFKRDVMLRYLWVLPNGFSCVTSMTLAFVCNGHPVKYVPVAYRKRIGISKFRPIADTVNYAMTVIRIVMYFRPLRVFVPAAAVLFLMATVSGVYNVLTSPLGLHDSDVLLSIAAIMVLGIGALADLIVAQRRDPS